MTTRHLVLALLFLSATVGCDAKEKECRQALTYAKPMEEMLKKGLRKKKFSESDFEDLLDATDDFHPDSDEEIGGLWSNYRGQLWEHALHLDSTLEWRRDIQKELKEDPKADVKFERETLSEYTTKLKGEIKTTREYREDLENHCGITLSSVESEDD